MNSINFKCTILNSDDEELLYGASECLTETFTGIKIGQTYISEPLSQVCKLNKEATLNFNLNYLRHISKDNLCIVAVDTNTSKVIGAIAGENYTPNEDSLSAFNDNSDNNNDLYAIFNFLSTLDNKFIDALENRLGRNVIKNEFIRGTMIGVRTELNKKDVANEMMSLLMREASSRGFKALFVEATNFRSQKFNMLNGFYVAKDLDGNPISNKYCEDTFFNRVPEDVGLECLVMIKPIEETFNLLY